MTLAFHVNRTHATQHKTFVCDVCGKRFKYKHNLRKHMNTHTTAPPYVCPTCGKGVFGCIEDHKQSHLKTKDHICSKCGNAFKFKRNLKRHGNSCSGPKLNAHVCSTCGKIFTRKCLLTEHLRAHKPAEYVCDVCGKSFRWRSSYHKHTKICDLKDHTF